MDRSIALRKHCLSQEEEKLKNEFAVLEKSSHTPYAKDKIEKITAGILEKNHPHTEELKEKTARTSELKEQIDELKKMKQGVDEQVKIDRNTARQIHYAVKKSASSSIPAGSLPPEILPTAVRLIAKALNQDPKAAALVARIADFEEVEYNALSELDKKLFRAKLRQD